MSLVISKAPPRCLLILSFFLRRSRNSHWGRGIWNNFQGSPESPRRTDYWPSPVLFSNLIVEHCCIHENLDYFTQNRS